MEIGPQHKNGAQSKSTAKKPTIRERVAELADRELAREKNGGNGSPAGAAVYADRIDEIKRRIDTGYYDRQDVRTLIADRLCGDLDDK